MIKIRNSARQLLAIMEDYINPSISERINRDYIFSFIAIIDGDKSEYINTDNIIEVDNQYFNIIHHRRMRSRDGSLMVQVDCEQVAYDLIDDPLNNFTQAGTPSAVLAFLLMGTGFTVGTVELVNVISVAINEATNKRAALIAIASASGGELKFDKYSISLLTQRGQNRSVQWRVGKNIAGITKDVDKRSGVLKTAYEIDIIELNSLEEYAGLEYFELGDTIKIIDTEIGVNANQRIVEYEYDPRLRMNSKVTIADFIDGIEDTLVRMQQITVVKDKLYNGTRIGPEIGFEAIRSDNKTRSVMNATEGIKIQKGDGTGNTWTDVIFLDTSGNAVFIGKITSGEGAIGGWIITADAIKDLSGMVGLLSIVTAGDDIRFFAGHATPASAPFYVTESGYLKAANADITGKVTATSGAIGGWIITADAIKDLSGTVGLLSIVTAGDDIRFFAGHATPASAPFYVTESGYLKAANADITGKVTATSGAIGGWIITADAIKDLSGMVGLLSIVTAGDDIRFFAGHAIPASAPFRVTESGVIHASNINITGGSINVSTDATIGNNLNLGVSSYAGSKSIIWSSDLGISADLSVQSGDMVINVDGFLSLSIGSSMGLLVDQVVRAASIKSDIITNTLSVPVIFSGSSTSSTAVSDGHGHGGLTSADYIQCYDSGGVATVKKQWSDYAGSAAHTHTV